MSGLSHSTNHNRFSSLKPGWLSLPAIRPFTQSKPEVAVNTLQIFTEGQPLPPSRRLVVILPDENVDVISLPRRIWNLAAPNSCNVLLAIKPCREENEFYARMNLTTLASIIRDPRVIVETQLILGQSMEQAARQWARPDDVFVCFEEHSVKGFLKKRRLAEILAHTTQRPVYVLKGKVSELVDPVSARLIDFFILALCLVSLIAFFALEVWIDRHSAGMLQSVFQILAVIAEVWVIGAIASRSFRI